MYLSGPISPDIAICIIGRQRVGHVHRAAHVRAGRAAGLREEAIEAVRHRADVSGLTPDERDIVTFVRQLLQTNRVEQELFDALRDRHSVRWLVELAATYGFTTVSLVNLMDLLKFLEQRAVDGNAVIDAGHLKKMVAYYEKYGGK